MEFLYRQRTVETSPSTPHSTPLRQGWLLQEPTQEASRSPALSATPSTWEVHQVETLRIQAFHWVIFRLVRLNIQPLSVLAQSLPH